MLATAENAERPGGQFTGNRRASGVGENPQRLPFSRRGDGAGLQNALSETGHWRRLSACQFQALGKAQSVSRDVFSERVTNALERLLIVRHQQPQPRCDRQSPEPGRRFQQLRAELLHLGVVMVQQAQQIIHGNRVTGVFALEQLHGPRAHQSRASLPNERKENRRCLRFLPRFEETRGRRKFAQAASVFEFDMGRAELHRVVLAEAGVHQSPTVEHVFAALQIGVCISDQRAGNRRNVSLRPAMTQPTKVTPGAAAQVIARAILEQFSVPRGADGHGHSFPSRRVYGGKGFFRTEHIARGDEGFFLISGTQLRIPARAAAHFAAHLAVVGDKKRRH